MNRFSQARRHRRISALALLVVLGGAVACSDDDTTTSGSGSNLGDTTATSAGTQATGEPIPVGFVNSEGGAFSVPELRVGNEVAEDYINTRLGGVAGRPLAVARCATDGSPESSIDCANQFVEAGVVAVVEGTDLGGDAMLPILADAGIPLVGHVQFGPARMFDDNSTYFGAAALAYGAAALQFYADEGRDVGHLVPARRALEPRLHRRLARADRRALGHRLHDRLLRRGLAQLGGAGGDGRVGEPGRQRQHRGHRRPVRRDDRRAA